MHLPAIDFNYGPSPSDLQSIHRIFFLGSGNKPQSGKAYLNSSKVSYAGLLLSERYCLDLAQNLRLLSSDLSGILVFFLPAGFTLSLPTFSKRASPRFITLICRVDVSKDLQMTIHSPSCLVLLMT